MGRLTGPQKLIDPLYRPEVLQFILHHLFCKMRKSFFSVHGNQNLLEAAAGLNGPFQQALAVPLQKRLVLPQPAAPAAGQDACSRFLSSPRPPFFYYRPLPVPRFA